MANPVNGNTLHGVPAGGRLFHFGFHPLAEMISDDFPVFPGAELCTEPFRKSALSTGFFPGAELSVITFPELIFRHISVSGTLSGTGSGISAFSLPAGFAALLPGPAAIKKPGRSPVSYSTLSSAANHGFLTCISSCLSPCSLPACRSFYQDTRSPGFTPASADRRKISFFPGPAERIMPSETPKRIFRGARL